MDPNTALIRIRDLIAEGDQLAARVLYDPNTAEHVLFNLTEAVEDLDRWMSRGGSLPEAWNTQTRIDRVEAMMCCGEPMEVFPTRMTGCLDTEVGAVILVWHCSECGHWEPYEPHPMDPDATVPNCLCGAAMVDVPPSQWDPSKFRIVMCTDCGAYDTWWATRHDSGYQREGGHTTECVHETRRLIDELNEECIDCGSRGPVDPSWDGDDGQS